jgi:hypothetical protein
VVAGRSFSAATARFSTVRIDPAAVPLVDVTSTFAPCICDNTSEMPPPLSPDLAST